MNILLINTNPVVSRLISLCIREDHTVLEEVTEISAVKLSSYDIVFVDDASYVSSTRQLLENIETEKKVLLLATNTLDEISEDFDKVIKKPFLPSEIRSVIDSLKHEENEDTPSDVHFIFPLSTEEESVEETSEPEEDETSKILDSNEIARIRSLLEEDEDERIVLPEEDYETRKREVITEHLEADGLEIVSEDEIINILSNKPEKSKKKRKKTEKKQKKSEKESQKRKRSNFYF